MIKQGDFDCPGSLMKKTMALAKDAGERKLVEISHTHNLPLSWIKKFMYGEWENPSVNRVQFLYEILSGNKITP